MKDSGKRRQFETGSQRDVRQFKGRFDLISWYAVFRVARTYEDGSLKYDAHNWRKGQPLSAYLDSGMRHLAKFAAGWRDEDHLSQAMWNVMALMETEKRIADGDLPEELNDLAPWTPHWDEVAANWVFDEPKKVARQEGKSDNT